MRTFRFFTMAACLCSWTAKAQISVELKTGPDVLDERNWMTKKIIGGTEKQFYVFNMGMDVSQLECFDAETLNSVYKKTIVIPYLRTMNVPSYSPEDLFPDHNMFLSEGKIVYLSAWFDKKGKTNNVFGQSFIAASGEQNGEIKTLATEQINKKKGKGNEYPKFTFYQSASGKNLLVIKHYDFENSFSYKVLDFDLNVVEEGVLTTTSLASDFSYDDQGNLFYLLSLETPKTKGSGGVKTYDYKLFSYNQKANTNTEYDIGLKERNITNLMYKLADNTIVIAGINNLSDEQDEFFYATIDRKNNNAVKIKQSSLEQPVPEHGLKLQLKDICLKEDGQAYVLAEQRDLDTWITRTTVTYAPYSLGTNSNPVSFHNQSPTHHALIKYGDIFIFSVGNDNGLNWERKIEKSQLLNYDSGYASYGYFIRDSDIYIFHNEIGQPVSMMIPYVPKGITVTKLDAKGGKESAVIGAEGLDKLALKPGTAFSKGPKLFAQSKMGKVQVMSRISK